MITEKDIHQAEQTYIRQRIKLSLDIKSEDIKALDSEYRPISDLIQAYERILLQDNPQMTFEELEDKATDIYAEKFEDFPRLLLTLQHTLVRGFEFVSLGFLNLYNVKKFKTVEELKNASELLIQAFAWDKSIHDTNYIIVNYLGVGVKYKDIPKTLFEEKVPTETLEEFITEIESRRTEENTETITDIINRIKTAQIGYAVPLDIPYYQQLKITEEEKDVTAEKMEQIKDENLYLTIMQEIVQTFYKVLEINLARQERGDEMWEH